MGKEGNTILEKKIEGRWIGERGREKRKVKEKKIGGWLEEGKETFPVVFSIIVAGEGSDRGLKKD